jgi:acetate kinase
MDVLVINCGSSSIKYRLYDMSDEHLLAKGVVEKIGEARSRLIHEADGRKDERECRAKNHAEAFDVLTDALIHGPLAAIRGADEIAAVGHRVVHGGEGFTQSVRIDEGVIRLVEQFAVLAPLHNPPNLVGIREAMKHFPNVPHVAVFDTAFHETMPPKAYLYALPYELYEKDRVRKYGFHGTSHRFVTERAAQLCGIPVERFNAITCHLGNGCSLAAVKNGRSVDTSMGLTPLEGVPMGTRSGDVDPAIVFFIAEQRGLSLEQINALMNKKSGLLGISGVSNDVRELWEAVDRGNARAKLALEIFAYRIRKYIGAYLAALGHTDAIVLTGGIGEHARRVRASILAGLEELGIQLDPEANDRTVGREGAISRPGSPIRVLVVPTNEELLIARDTAAIAG